MIIFLVFLVFLLVVAVIVVSLLLGVKIFATNALAVERDELKKDVASLEDITHTCETNLKGCTFSLHACINSRPEETAATINSCKSHFTPEQMCSDVITQVLPDVFNAAIINRNTNSTASLFLSTNYIDDGVVAPVGAEGEHEMIITIASTVPRYSFFISYSEGSHYLVRDGTDVVIRTTLSEDKKDDAVWVISFTDPITRIQSVNSKQVLTMDATTHLVGLGLNKYSADAQWIVTPSPTLDVSISTSY